MCMIQRKNEIACLHVHSYIVDNCLDYKINFACFKLEKLK